MSSGSFLVFGGNKSGKSVLAERLTGRYVPTKELTFSQFNFSNEPSHGKETSVFQGHDSEGRKITLFEAPPSGFPSRMPCPSDGERSSIWTNWFSRVLFPGDSQPTGETIEGLPLVTDVRGLVWIFNANVFTTEIDWLIQTFDSAEVQNTIQKSLQDLKSSDLQQFLEIARDNVRVALLSAFCQVAQFKLASLATEIKNIRSFPCFSSLPLLLVVNALNERCCPEDEAMNDLGPHFTKLLDRIKETLFWKTLLETPGASHVGQEEQREGYINLLCQLVENCVRLAFSFQIGPNSIGSGLFGPGSIAEASFLQRVEQDQLSESPVVNIVQVQLGNEPVSMEWMSGTWVSPCQPENIGGDAIYKGQRQSLEEQMQMWCAKCSQRT